MSVHKNGFKTFILTLYKMEFYTRIAKGLLFLSFERRPRVWSGFGYNLTKSHPVCNFSGGLNDGQWRVGIMRSCSPLSSSVHFDVLWRKKNNGKSCFPHDSISTRRDSVSHYTSLYDGKCGCNYIYAPFATVTTIWYPSMLISECFFIFFKVFRTMQLYGSKHSCTY